MTFTLLFAELHRFPNFQYTVIIGLFITILANILRYYFKYKIDYRDFPSYPLLFSLVCSYLLRKIPKNVPVTSFFLEKLASICKRYENDGLLLVWFLRPQLLVFGEEAVKIFSNEEECIDKPYQYEILQDIVGLGLGTSNGERWKKCRKIFNPLFHYGNLKDKIFILNENADELIKKLNKVPDKSSIDILPYLKLCSFGCLCESLLGIKMNDDQNKALVQDYFKIITKLLAYSTYRVTQPWLRFKFLLNFTSTGREYLKLYEENQYFTEKIVSEMIKSLSSQKPSENNSSKKSFFALLIERNMADSSFTQQHLNDEVTTFMTAGFYSVAHTVMWCVYMLGLHEDAQEKVYDEVISRTREVIIFADLSNLNYLDCIIKETMRIYPTIPLYGRHLNKDVQCGKYNVPKGTDIVFFPYSLHRNSLIYSDPEKFDPDRFLEGYSGQTPWNYTCFAEGIRNCIGKKFAFMEIKVVLAHIIRNYKITSLDNRENLVLCWDVVLKTASPLRMKLVPRSTLPLSS